MFSNIIKMKMNKRQKKKFRQNTENLLENVKDKLKVNYYNKLKEKIKEGRIDAVKNTNELIKDITKLRNVNTKSIHASNIKEIIKSNKTASAKLIQRNIYKSADIIPKVNQFNKTGKQVRFTNLTSNKMKNIVKKLDLTKRVVLQAGNSFYTITPENVNKFLEDIDKFFVRGGIEGTGSDAEYWSELVDTPEIIIARPTWLGKSNNEGAFFNYYNNYKCIDLTDFQIYNCKTDYKENCFVEAIKQSNLLTDNEIYDLRNMVVGRYVATKHFTSVAKRFNLFIEVKHINSRCKKTYGNKNADNVRIITMGLIDKHYFIFKEVPYNMFAIENIDKILHLPNWNMIGEYNKTKDCFKVRQNRFTNSFHLIKYMYENKEKYFTKLPYEDYISSHYHDEAPEITNLNYSSTALKLNEKPKSFDDGYKYIIVFYDFETSTEGLQHKEYIVCYSVNGRKRCKYGEKCGLYMMRDLYETYTSGNEKVKLIFLYFHTYI